MPCTVTDKYGYRSAAGTLVPLPTQTIIAVPSSPLLTYDFDGDWRPGNAINPLITGGPPYQYGVTTQTAPDGSWSLTLPYAEGETEPADPPARWTLLFPDGSALAGVVPDEAGPLGVRDLVKAHGWEWTANVYVAPVTAGSLARGTAVFSGGSATATILFVGDPFDANTYVLTLGASVDSNDGSLPRVAWSAKTTTGVVLHVDSADYVGRVDWRAEL